MGSIGETTHSLSNGTGNGSLSPAAERENGVAKPGPRIDVQLRELYAESHAAKLWRVATELLEGDVRLSILLLLLIITDNNSYSPLYPASPNSSPPPATPQDDIRPGKPNSGPAASSPAACTPCWSAACDFPDPSPLPESSTDERCTTNCSSSAGAGWRLCTAWPRGGIRTTWASSSCRRCG